MTPHRHPTPTTGTTPFRRANKSLESWALSDFGRLSMTPRTPQHASPILAPRTRNSSSSLTSSASSSSWTTSPSSPASSVSSFPTNSIRASPVQQPSIPRPRQSSTSSSSSSGNNSEGEDELPDYNTFLAQQEREKIKPFPHEDREVKQALREVEGYESEEEERVTSGGRFWR